MLKQEDREHEQTWSTLTTARALPRWQKASLGEIQNWQALMSNWWHGLVSWVIDYLTNLTVCSIYRLWGGGAWIWVGVVAVEDEKGSLAHELGGFHRGGSPTITGHARRDSLGCGTTLEHVAHGGKRPTATRFIPIDRRVSGTVSLAVTDPKLIQAPRSLLRRDYPLTREHESRRLCKSWRKSHRRRGG
jgi:hypothetical protein